MGLYLPLNGDPDKAFAKARELALPTVEIYNDDFRPELGDAILAAARRHNVTPVALFSMGPGDMAWDFVQGPATIGLVPAGTRARRVAHLKDASAFAKKCGIPMVETHCGFIPENPADALYRGTVEAIREAASVCRTNGQKFLYHAGQETPVTLLRVIRDVGLDNQGVGLDTANPVMYGKGNPVDAAEQLGPYLALINAKDGLFPSNPNDLGPEVPIGRGKVDFARLFQALAAVRYRGPILIERETSGPQWEADVRAAKLYLEKRLGAMK